MNDEGTASDATSVTVLDARGLRCPQPVILLARTARAASAGTLVEVLTTDPAAGPDIAAWCRMRGHELVEQSGLPEPGQLRSVVRVSVAQLSGETAATPPAERPAVGG